MINVLAEVSQKCPFDKTFNCKDFEDSDSCATSRMAVKQRAIIARAPWGDSLVRGWRHGRIGSAFCLIDFSKRFDGGEESDKRHALKFDFEIKNKINIIKERLRQSAFSNFEFDYCLIC